jgi:integrase
LTFDQAKRRVIALADDAAKAVGGHASPRRSKTAPYTVADAMATYLDYLDSKKKSGHNSRVYANGSILPKLGHIRLRDLDKATISDWLDDLAASPRKTRAPAGVLAPPVTDEDRRKRRSSANRVYTVLRAALNMAFVDEHAASDAAWRRVKPLAEADAARVRAFTDKEQRALVAAAEEPFRQLLMAALFCGARYSELARMVCGDLDEGSDTLLVRLSKAGKPRSIFLTKEACAFFARQCAGRDAEELIFRKADGTEWKSGQQDKVMVRTCRRAGVAHGGFHACRHSYATAALQAHVPPMVVAKNLGHADLTMLEKHYAHLTDAHSREMIQERMKPLGLDDASAGR